MYAPVLGIQSTNKTFKMEYNNYSNKRYASVTEYETI